jgi:hypothetical protein
MKHRSLIWPIRLLVPLTMTLLVACGGGGSSSPTPTPKAKLVSIAVNPSAPSFAKGLHQQLTATGNYSDGTTKDLTTSASWNSSAAGIANVSKGMVSALATGSATISASAADSVSGATISGDTAVTITAAILVSMAVTPGSPSVALGLHQQLIATGTFSDKSTQDLSATATWTSSDATVASVSAGQVTTLKQGSANVSASLNSVIGSTMLTVAPANLVSVAVTPASASVAKGNKQQFTATGTYTDNSTQDLSSTVTWTATAGVTISNAGLATGSSMGSAIVKATAGSTNSNSAALTVTAPVLASITVAPASIVVPKGLTQNYTATGVYSDGTTQNLTSTVSWTSTSGASINSAGLATANVLGQNTITATSGSINGTADMTVAAGALMSLAVSPSSVTIPKGTTQAFTVIGTFSDATTQDMTTAVAWSATTGASITNAGVATGTGVGGVTITATSNTIHGNAALTVAPPALVSITVTPATVSVVRSSNQQFTATGTYTDASTLDLTATATWSASVNATIASTGLAHATAVGTSNITATSGVITSNSAVMTVTLPALTSIAITPGSVSLGIGAIQQYVAMGTYADSITSDVTGLVTWNSNNSSVAAFGANGAATVVSTGSTAVSITAISGAVTSNVAFLSALASLPRVCYNSTIDMKLLVVTNGKVEVDYTAITQILDYVGTPYDVLDMTINTGGVTSAMLSDGTCHGYYQGVIMASGGYIYTLPGMSTLTSYETTFKARQVNWFTYPGSDFGLGAATSTINPGTTVTGNFTSAAAAVFPQVNTSTALTITNATVYPAAAGGTGTPLITDNSGHVLSAINDFGDGREYLTQTFDSNQYLTHNLVLAYGLLNWVTKGIFLGEYHVYLTPQIDDVFIADAMWEGTTPCVDPASPSGDHTDADVASLNTVRMAKADVDALVAWQTLQQQNPLFSNFVLHMAFNGAGTTGSTSTGGYRNDTLTPEFKLYQDKFKWLSHTWDHPDTLDAQTTTFIDDEIAKNNAQALVLGLTTYDPAGMVTPGITGLNDSTYVTEAVANGIKYVVTDTSVLNTPNNGPNPSPNVGMVNTINSGLYMVPRHANNLFFNVADPDGWAAEYDCIYTGQAPYASYTAEDIRANISQSFIVNMLKGDMDPQMFHQPNLVAYDGTHSLLSDLIDETFSTYASLYKLPVLSPTLQELAASMQARNNYNLSGVTASLVGNTSIEITIPSSSPVTSATIPVTGLNSTGAEVYGGQNISHIQINVGQTQTLPLQ